MTRWTGDGADASGTGKDTAGDGYGLFLDAGKFAAGTVQYNDRSGRAENSTITIDRQKTGTPLGTATTLDTLEYVFQPRRGSWTPDMRVWITCDEPLPLTVLGVGPNIDMHESQFSRR